MTKRILAILLAICMVVGTLPPVSAEQHMNLSAAEAVALVETEQERAELLNNGATDYRQWAQGDSRWGSLPLGTSSCTVASHGCLVTSITKLIIQAGLREASTFNVATLVNWLNANSGFVSGTGNLYWAKPSTYIPEFVNYGHLLQGTYSSSGYNSTLMSYLNQGYHLVLGVNNNGHWVAVDEAKSLATGTIYIMDTTSSSANVNVTLASRYSTFSTVHGYKGGSTAQPNVDLGDDFTAPILNTKAWKPIENASGTVQMSTDTGKSTQLWYFDRQTDGSYVIYSCDDGTCLTVQGGASSAGTAVVTSAYTGSDAQKWLAQGSSGAYTFRAKCTSCVLDMSDNNSSDGNPVIMYTSNGTDAQLWQVYKGAECILSAPVLTVSSAGDDSAEEMVFTWTKSFGAKSYTLRIYDSEGGLYSEISGVSSGYSCLLPEGSYTAAVEASHSFASETSEAVAFAVTGHDWVASTTTAATCQSPAVTTFVCTGCGEYYSEETYLAYEDWSEIRPEGVDEAALEMQTQYRVRNRETTTSYEPGLPGWTLVSSQWEKVSSGTVKHTTWPSGFSSSHSLYAAYNGTAVSASETETEKVVVDSDAVSGYIYWHWCRGDYTAGPIDRTIESNYTTTYDTFHAFYSTTNPNSLTQVTGGGHKYSNASCCVDTYWWFALPVYTQTYTTYRNLFTYERWSDWSDWSDTPGTGDEVEERTAYRYRFDASDWSEEEPEAADGVFVESKTEYSCQNYETTASHEPELPGWTLVSSQWEKESSGTVQHTTWPSGFSSSHSLYAAYNGTPVSASETETEKVVVDSDGVSGYIYWHWCRGDYTAGPIDRTIESNYTTTYDTFHAFYSTTNPNTLTQVTGGGHKYSNASCCVDTYWWFALPVYTQSYTTYNKLFTYERWSDWSDWSETPSTPGDTCRVQTRTLHRSVRGVLAAHCFEEGSCTVCGSTDPDFNVTPVTLTVGNVSGRPGDTVTVPVTIADNGGFAGFTLCISYDETAMTLTNISKGAILNSSETGAFTKNVAGGTVNWVDAVNTSGDGELLKLTFAISGKTPAGDYAVTLALKDGNATNFVDENSIALRTEFVSGGVAVEERHIEIASGYSGALTWTLTDDGTLTFSGEGKMRNYTYKSEMPWYAYADQIRTVVLEEGVTSIGDYAFYGMDVENVVIASTVTSIGEYAFKNATKLDNVTLPEGLTKLGESAFYACTGLTSIEIPASLWTVQPYTFKNCTALASVTFHEGNLQKISDGAFYNTALTELVLPDCLTILDAYSFKNCAMLTSIALGSGLTELREAVFYATAIPIITVPEGIKKVGPYAFKNCVKLQTIDLPESLTSVGEASFYACTALKTVELPDAVTAIGNYAFRKCAALRNLTLSENLETIGESSFYGCESLYRLTVPGNVTTIKGYAFKGCTELGIVELPDSLQTLGESAFHTCPGLEEITIPVGVTKIGEYCFSGSTGIRTIEFLGDAPAIGDGAFNRITATAYYPDGNSTWTASVCQNYGGKLTWSAN